MSKKGKKEPPGNESTPELREFYLTMEWTAGKGFVKKSYQERFGEDPENIFFGPPNGSLIYAGPIPNKNNNGGSKWQ